MPGFQTSAGPPPSKALPIVVAAGLAVGVFGGLVIMNSPNDAAEASSGSLSEDAGGSATGTAGAVDDRVGLVGERDAAPLALETADAGMPDREPEIVASITADAGPAAAADEIDQDRGPDRPRRADRGRDQPDRTSTPKRNKDKDLDVALTPSAFADDSGSPSSVTLRFEVTPRVEGVRIIVNGDDVSNSTHKIRLGGRAKKVRVVARARGYRTWNRTYTISRDQTIRIRMQKPSVVDSPGGLIDL